MTPTSSEELLALFDTANTPVDLNRYVTSPLQVPVTELVANGFEELAELMLGPRLVSLLSASGQWPLVRVTNGTPTLTILDDIGARSAGQVLVRIISVPVVKDQGSAIYHDLVKRCTDVNPLVRAPGSVASREPRCSDCG